MRGRVCMRSITKRRVPLRKEDGGITLECALIMPLIMTIILALFSCIKLLAAQMALQSAVSETVKLVSAHMYEIRAVMDAVESEMRGAMSGKGTAAVQHVSYSLDMLEPFLPDALRPVVEALRLLVGEGTQASRQMLAAVLLPLLKQQAASPWLKEDDIRIVDLLAADDHLAVFDASRRLHDHILILDNVQIVGIEVIDLARAFESDTYNAIHDSHLLYCNQ